MQMQQNNTTHKEIIKLAEEVGLLIADDNFPYSCSPHMRFISRLQKFAEKVIALNSEKS